MEMKKVADNRIGKPPPPKEDAMEALAPTPSRPYYNGRITNMSDWLCQDHAFY
jgi:hypothetical protein